MNYFHNYFSFLNICFTYKCQSQGEQGNSESHTRSQKQQSTVPVETLLTMLFNRLTGTMVRSAFDRDKHIHNTTQEKTICLTRNDVRSNKIFARHGKPLPVFWVAVHGIIP